MSQLTIEINPTRIEFLLEMFKLSKGGLLEKLNEEYKRKLNYQDIFTNTIHISRLKKIDKIFKQGLPFYTDPIDLSADERHSIFFRKENFNTDLNISDCQTVNKIEKEISHLNVLTTLSNYHIERILPRYHIKHSPQEIAEKMRQKIYPEKNPREDKDFLKALINNLAKKQVLVMEFLEAWNTTIKMNIDGFFIAPHYIAIKRQLKNLQQAGNLQDDNFKREIFTLAHELGHYLLGEEEIDQPVSQSQNASKVEKWCNAFAFAFLMGRENITQLNSIESPKLGDRRITKLSQENHISHLALFTNLAFNKKISPNVYGNIIKLLQKKNKEKQMENKIERTRQDNRNKKIFSPARPIRSELEKTIYRNAFLEGVIEEYEVLSHFNLKKIDRFVYE